jgi:hypothetical protein
MGYRHHLEPIQSFAPEYVRQRMFGFEKDARICLTSANHPFENRPTVAFFPAVGLCCATLEHLSALYSGNTNGPRVENDIWPFSDKYLPAYSRDSVKVLFEAIRHGVAHRGIAARVWEEKQKNRPQRIFTWRVSAADESPSLRILEIQGEASPAPWPCVYTHRIDIFLGRLWKDVRDAGNSYAHDLATDAELLPAFSRCMEKFYPRRRKSRAARPEAQSGGQ